MSKIEIPKFNQSLKAFSSFITGALVLGAVLLLIGLISIAGAPVVGAALAYLGSVAISLAVVAVFLRQTAMIIVEGLGGSIAVDLGTSAKGTLYDFDASQDEATLAGKLMPTDFEKWNAAGRPSLQGFAKSGFRNFENWLKQL